MKVWFFKGLVIVAACLVLFGGSGSLFYQHVANAYQQQLDAHIDEQLVVLRDNLALELGHMSQALSFMVDQAELHDPIGNEQGIAILSEDFLSFLNTSSFYDQVRFLDMRGRELIRANYNRGQPGLTSQADLQDKHDRYYFTEGLKLARGEVYVSPFDLNLEHGKIEAPIKPTLRLVQPVYAADGKKIGLVVLNVLGYSILEHVGLQNKSTSAESLSLLKEDGYWLEGKNTEDLWAFMYPERKGQSLAVRSPEVWQKISDADAVRAVGSQGVYLSRNLSPTNEFSRAGLHVEAPECAWKLVAFYSHAFLEQKLEAQNYHMIMFGALSFGLIVAMIILSVMRLRMQKRLHEEAELRSREQAMEHEKFRSVVTIAGGVGHEFNNIMTGILGYTYLMRPKLAGQPELLGRLGEIDALGQRAAKMVRHLMTFAQVDLSLHEKLCLNDLLREQVALFQQQLSSTTLIQVALPEEPVYVYADPNKLKAMVQELLGNALDAVVGKPEPRISLSLSVSERVPADIAGSGKDMLAPAACLLVMDNGCGIAGKNLSQVIEPFFTTKESAGGVGLGLSLVYGVVQSLQGQVQLDSQEGRGTSVQVCLPLQKADED